MPPIVYSQSRIQVRAPPASSFTSTFPATENPIFQDGGWVRGGTEGVKWTDPRTTGGAPGIAWATMTAFDGTHYIDSIAHRTGFSANHRVTGKLHNASAVNGLECELLTRFQITNGNARGYEWDLVITSGDFSFVRWNGPGGTDGSGPGVAFDVILSHQAFVGGASYADGRVWSCDTVGPLCSLYCDGIQQASVDVQAWATTNGGSYWSDGQPGMGFWNESGSSSSTFGLQSITMQNL